MKIISDEENKKLENTIIYGAIHNEEKVRKKSRAGGAFTAFSDIVLEKKGVIYGCVLNDEFKVVHIRGTDKDARDKMRGSKYVQSDLGENFKLAREDLKDGKYVMFVGTPCQIAGFKNFVDDVDKSKLFLIDIVCHGVPSQLLLDKYLEYYEKRKRGKVIDFDFRDKAIYGWESHYEVLNINGKKYYNEQFSNIFSSGKAMRPSCCRCKYKTYDREGDVSLGDFWGIARAIPKMSDSKGTSLIMLNTIKGKNWFNEIKGQMSIEESTMEACAQLSLKGNVLSEAERVNFFKDFHSKPFKYVAYKYGERGFIYFIKQRIKLSKMWRKWCRKK